MRSFIILGITAMVFSACNSHTSTTPPQKADSNAWPEHMQGMASSVYKLMPFIYNEKAFEDPANRSEIKTDIQQFSNIAHEIDPKMGEKILGHDPLVSYNLSELKADLARAQESFEMGSLDYSRGTMKNIFNHCFGCHSLDTAGNKIRWDLSAFRNLRISPVEKADLLVASRQFGASKEVLEGLLRNPDFIQNSPFEFESALRRYLALMVRVKKDPKGALHELEGLENRKEVPFYVQDHLHSWMESLRNWAHEKPSKDSLLAQAQRRIRAAHRLQSFAKDHSGDVEYLRVTSLLHDYLRAPHEPNKNAEAYYLLGQSYEVMDELGYWNLHETYYESCIRVVPKTEQAKNCFRRLQASIFLGFTGSSGLHVPQSEQQRLNDLKSLL